MENPISALNHLRQSLWYDNIQRQLIENGELARLINRGDIRGITSNPSIFQNAIAKSSDYDSALIPLSWSGKDAESIFWELAIEDIRAAADLLLPVYQKSKKSDGYVSLEVNPLLARDTNNTIAQAKALWARVDRPNLMIKIPATEAGIPAIREVIAAGINVNVTLVFSLLRYAEVMNAYLEGLEARVKSGLPVDHIASVASFFVSRLDTKVDGRLQQIANSQPKQASKAISLMGKAAIANAKLAYSSFVTTFTSERFASLRSKHSAQIQRPLWASTSTKNPSYPDTLYVDNLIGPDTVNTVPPQTLKAFRDHGVAEVTLTRNLPQAGQLLEEIESLGILIDLVTKELEEEGVKAFSDSFTSLLETIESRRKQATNQLGPSPSPISRRISRLAGESASARLHAMDPSLWTPDPDAQNEIKIRLGWIKANETFRPMIPEINAFVKDIRSAGFTQVLLLGMGGSSLAPEVMEKTFTDVKTGGLQFAILDSTDPVQVADLASKFPLKKTLYIVSSKSGGTAEVNALFNYFWELGGQNGAQFIAITDPKTALETQAINLGFRKIFLSDPTIGGRFSALSPFGLVPAALIGIDVEKLLTRADWMAAQCTPDFPSERNPGLTLGAILGQMSLDGRDKLTLIADESLAPFGAWLEQLIAESSGKNGKGIVVVNEEPLGLPEEYGDDRLFVYLRSFGEYDQQMAVLSIHGHPVVTIKVDTPYDLGAEFYRWEYATAIACAVLGINAFDQPDVQFSKDITKSKVAQFAQTKKLEEGPPAWEGDQVQVFSPHEITGSSAREILIRFLKSAGKNDFVGINAYIPRSAPAVQILTELRIAIRQITGCATTVGFGPRFLHSTGQLHKGGENIGVFVQMTIEPQMDLDIPTQNLSFGVLERAQALGDFEALVSRGRRIIRIHFPSMEKLKELAAAVNQSPE
jgi:transaldolase/glucose-6-phosphate isomerase